MTNSISKFLAATLMGGIFLAVPVAALAVKGDCGQPSSMGANPSVSDALTVLRDSVGQQTDCDTAPDNCICDVNSTNTITVGDALLVLQKSVGQNVVLNCPCEGVTTTTTTLPPPPGFPCTSAEFQSRTGSDLDSGWTGIAHNSDLILGASITFRTLRKCSDNQAPCEKDSDCGSNNCVPTCDCLGDTSCEITGPTHGKNCLTTLKECTVNADCGTSTCVSTFGPPLPLSSGGTPVCVVSVFDSLLTGTANSATGEAETAANLKSRVFLGITIDKPCPRCGAPDENPQIGDTFNCSGGQFENAPCTVDGVSPTFGGTSFDCPPKLDANVSGAGLAIRFTQVTTGTSTKVAELPCSDTAFRENPSLPLDVCIGGSAPGANCTSDAQCAGGGTCNQPVCLGTTDRCSSNADCKRCTGDSSIDCTDNAGACTGNGTCEEAPDQPVTCGYWCQCGFCNGNASAPCFQTSDCAEGQTCQQGPGSGSAQNVPQRKPNDCAQDDFICGTLETERCATTPVGKCSEQPYRSCTAGSNTCEINLAGECVITARPCFESRISRTGDPSPLGMYCAFENKTCTTNSDCNGGVGDFCADDASRPETVALFCVPGTSNPGINNVGGITGPGAVRLNGFIQVCRCGDGDIGCDEECDDGNTSNADDCSDLCQDQ